MKTSLAFIPACAAAVAALAVFPAGAAVSEIAELSLATDTNAVVDVAAGDRTVVSKISGNRGTITKTGDWPVMTATGTFSGSIDGWTLSADTLRGSARLFVGDDGVYVHLDAPGSIILVR